MHRPRRTRAVLSAGLAGVVAAVGFVTATNGPAGAESTSTSCQGQPGKAYVATPEGWPNQCWMVNDTNVTGQGLDRETWVLDPGVGNFLSRDQLIAHLGDYQGQGFNPNFLWYAPLGKVEPARDSRWS
ncbi:MAG TPA: hypothetical protein VFU36_11515, partial [Jatrophihabitans sp.]|nr:hypothetical protein [Jatrophihabitans sp.]